MSWDGAGQVDHAQPAQPLAPLGDHGELLEDVDPFDEHFGTMRRPVGPLEGAGSMAARTILKLRAPSLVTM